MSLRNLLAALVLAAWLAPAGCVSDAPPAIELAPETLVPQRSALVIWVDGLGADRFEALRQAGKLPHITRYLVDRGVSVEAAVASYPTITYANNVSFSTGLLPGHHGVVGNKWFDRHRLVLQNYNFIKSYQQVDEDFAAPTIYERLGADFTATILTPVRRGATRNIDNWASAGIAWYFGLQATVNRLTTARFELIADVANRCGRWPRFILAYFVTPDTVGHARGASSEACTEMILDVDRQVGHICAAYEKAGLLGRTVITLVSDHGFVDTPQHFDVARFFRKALKVPTCSRRYGRDEPFENRVRHFEAARAVVVAGGNRRCAIHLRAGAHWWRRPTEAEIDGFVHAGGPPSATTCAAPPRALPALLAAHPAVDLLVVRRGPDSVRVQDADGAGAIDRVRRDGKKLYRYRVLQGTDPLGHSSDMEASALMDDAHHDADAWLHAGLGTARPDAVVQLAELNDSPRSGDVWLFASAEWDFAPGDAGGHGGLLRREIVVPWVWAGPGLPAGATLRGARTVDLMPTILHLIGRAEAIPPAVDGRSIADRLRNAGKSGPGT